MEADYVGKIGLPTSLSKNLLDSADSETNYTEDKKETFTLERLLIMFRLYLITFASARKSYRTGLLFTHFIRTVISVRFL